jgi:hypothetical protein
VRADSKSRYKKIVVNRHRVQQFFLDVFFQAHRRRPNRIIIDLDATDDPLHGNQSGRFFHGYYQDYCYLPLYIFCGEHLLAARLRPSNIDASAGALKEIQRIVAQVRRQWPKTEILIRADSGFCREPIMAWCEANEVDYLFGLAKNRRLTAEIEAELEAAREKFQETGEAARVYKDFAYQTLTSWTCSRRVIGKAEYLSQGANPRFVVTSLSKDKFDAATVYEANYCPRGDMENRIKEQQLQLFADRTSCATMRANELRMWFSAVAYTLTIALRRLGLQKTDLQKAQPQTIRLKLLKIGALISVSVRKVWISLAESYPYQQIFAQAWANLQAAIEMGRPLANARAPC